MSRIETASVQEWMRYWAERAPQLLSNLEEGEGEGVKEGERE